MTRPLFLQDLGIDTTSLEFIEDAVRCVLEEMGVSQEWQEPCPVGSSAPQQVSCSGPSAKPAGPGNVDECVVIWTESINPLGTGCRL